MIRRRLLMLIILLCPVLPAGADSDLTEVEKQLASGHYREALSRLDELLVNDRHNPLYQFTRALALTRNGQTGKAIAQYQALIKAYPDLPESYNNLAVIYFQQGKAEQARRVLEQAMQAHSGYARVYQNLQALNAAKARDAYARALQMPAKQATVKLAAADKLVLQQAAIASVRPAPAVGVATKPALKPAMVYQAKNTHADKKTITPIKPPVTTGEDFARASAVLDRWATAWATKNVDQYLQFYSSDYSPAGMSRSYWEKQRQMRINKPKWIKVTLRNIQLHAKRGSELVIWAEQEYAADNYSDVTRKEFVMQNISGEWRITKERGLGYLAK